MAEVYIVGAARVAGGRRDGRLKDWHPELMATLVHGLHTHDKKWGLQTMCEGGGLANVTIVERL